MSCDKFLLFGDSITQYAFNTKLVAGDGNYHFTLGPALCDIYTRKLDIVQRGYAGYNTRWALKILPQVLKNESNIVIGTIFFGSNDAVSRGPQHIPLAEFEANTKELVSMMKSKGIKPILVGPALPDQDAWGKHMPEAVENNYIRDIEGFKTYSNALDTIAQEENIPFVNLHQAFIEKGGKNWKALLCDGLHFSGAGYQIFYDELLKAIEISYPEYSHDRLPMKYPPWRDTFANPDLLEQ